MTTQVISGNPTNPRDVYIYGMNVAQKRLLRDLAREVAQRFGEPVIVNIGVDYGGSMYCFRMGAPKARLIGVDIRYHQGVDLSPLEAVLIEGNSNRVHDQVPPPMHLLFVDGGHDRETVSGDIRGWVPKVAIGGIVIFHDVELPGISKAIEEWWDGKEWEEIAYIHGPFDWTSGMTAYRRLDAG